MNKLIHNPKFESTTIKNVTPVRILFTEEFTKIDFCFDHTKIKLIENMHININADIYLETGNKKYRQLKATTYDVSYFTKESDYRYFSVFFEHFKAEDIRPFDIVDDSRHSDIKNRTYHFSFTGIKI